MGIDRVQPRSATPHGGRASAPTLALGVALLAVSAGCDDRRDPRAATSRRAPPPVILVSIDTLRSDRLPAYGYRAGRTPAIDALRGDAILVERAYTHVPLTLPAHASMLTGLLPTEHGVRDNLGYRLRSDVAPLASRLRQAGYSTGGAVSAVVLASSTGIAGGFDVWREPGDGGAAAPERAGSETLAAILPWIREVAARPFFLFFHLYEPHAPYRPPPERATALASGYDAEVAAADAVVGDLVAELRALDVYHRALLILTSDHGEGLGDHGEQEHGVFLYREALQVPLLLKLPGGERAGTTIDTPAQLVDVVPTVLDAAALPVPPRLPGVSLLGSAASGGERRLYAETYYPRLHFGWSELRSLVAGRLHFIEAPQPELYDLVGDPAERHDLLEREPAVSRALRAALAAVPDQIAEPAAESAAVRERLSALGYLAAPASTRGSLPDPKTKRDALASLERAIDLETRGDLDGSAGALRELAREAPDATGVWSRLAATLERLGRYDEALEARRRALELTGGGAAEALELARLLLERGRFEEAREHARLAGAAAPREASDMVDAALLHEGRALARAGAVDGARNVLAPLLDRGDREAAIVLATALAEAGRPAEAAALLEPLVARGQDDARTHETLGLTRLRAGDAVGAIDSLERAVALDPVLANAWNLLGVARLRGARDVDGALQAWERGLEIDPARFDLLFNLATVAADAGRVELARASLERFVAHAPAAEWSAEIGQARELLSTLARETP